MGDKKSSAKPSREFPKAGIEHPGFVAAVVALIKEMVTRLGPLALPILLMIAGFRMPGYISSAMAFPLFKSLDYSDTDIAMVTKLFGFWVALGATFFSSYIIRRIGMMPSLLLGTVSGGFVAGGPGFEPRLTESESAMSVVRALG